jgi:quercetin dioxygenase-like cupin family protein
VAEWEVPDGQSTTVSYATGADALLKAPANATRYTMKVQEWRTGTVSVLNFTKANGGVLHAITKETELYVLKGSAQVTVDGEVVTLAAGDVAFEPSGVLHRVGAGEDTTIVTWTAGNLEMNARPAVVRGKDVPGTPAYQWMRDGQVVRASTAAEAANAPSDAVRLVIQRYAFPGNSIRVAHIMRGGVTTPATAKTDSLIYFTSGHVRFHEGNQVYDVNPGDFIYEEAGQQHVWEHLEDASFVTTSALPLGAQPIAPAQATDMPPAR